MAGDVEHQRSDDIVLEELIHDLLWGLLGQLVYILSNLGLVQLYHLIQGRHRGAVGGGADEVIHDVVEPLAHLAVALRVLLREFGYRLAGLLQVPVDAQAVAVA